VTARWKDSLLEGGEETLAGAAQSISAVLAYPGRDDDLALALAGGIIRAHRKRLGVETRRDDDYLDTVTDEDLLWRALLSTCRAALTENIGYAALELRAAEDALRTYWKRQQGGTS